MNYYRIGDSVVQTIGTLNADRISKEEFDAEIDRVQQEIENAPRPEPQPTMEERLSQLEEENRQLKAKLNQVEILTGGDSV